jgi:hypothetical protein
MATVHWQTELEMLFTRFLDCPEDISTVMSFCYKLLLDVYRWKFTQWEKRSEAYGALPGFVSLDLNELAKLILPELVAEASFGWNAELVARKAGMSDTLAHALEKFHALPIFYFVSDLSAQLDQAFIPIKDPAVADDSNEIKPPDSPSRTILLRNRLTDEEFSAKAGKYFILQLAFKYVMPKRPQLQTLCDVVKRRPVFLLLRSPEGSCNNDISVSGSLPSLDSALGRCLKLDFPTFLADKTFHESFRRKAIDTHLNYFIRLGVYICAIWTHFQNPDQSQFLFGLLETRYTFNRDLDYLRGKLPLPIFTSLCQINLADAWCSIWSYVHCLRYELGIPIHYLGWRTYDMIVNVARRQDPGGIIGQVLDLYCQRRYRYVGQPNFCPVGFEKNKIPFSLYPFPFRRQPQLHQNPENQAEIYASKLSSSHENGVRGRGFYLPWILEPVGPRIDIKLHADLVSAEFPPGTCSICSEALCGRGLLHRVIRLLVCRHEFHSFCMQIWMNSGEERSNVCPECDMVIFPETDRRVMPPPRDLGRMVEFAEGAER